MTDLAEMGPGWTRAWSSPNGDAVWVNREKGWARIDMPVFEHDGHGQGTFCAGCLGRIEYVLKVARHVLAGKKPPAPA